MRENQRERTYRICRYVAAMFALALAFTFAVNTVKRDKKFSETENRMLADKPELSVDGIISGKFMKQYETYQSDQFMGRDFWLKIKTRTDLLLGKRESNGVYKGKNKYLLEKIKVPDEQANRENLDAMKKFRKKYSDVNMYMMLVPNAANILSDKLPNLAVNPDQKKQIAAVRKTLGKDFRWVDVQRVLEQHSKEDIYYRTDHHWTTIGAYYAYLELMKTAGRKDEELAKFQRYVVSNTFNGTLSSTSGYGRKYKDKIGVYIQKGSTVDAVVTYVDEQEKSASLYALPKLDTKDKYGMFLNGNHALVQINTNSKSKDRLLVFKDSYANCFVPFLVPYYREIVVVDPRYFYGEIDELMSAGDITDVLFLYNANTFVEDHNISGVLAGE